MTRRSWRSRWSPQLAQVQVIATPGDAELFVDGKSRGAANQTIKLPTHSHKLEVRKPGFVTFETDVTPRKGIRKRIKVRLKTPEEAAAGEARASVHRARSNDKATRAHVRGPGAEAFPRRLP